MNKADREAAIIKRADFYMENNYPANIDIEAYHKAIKDAASEFCYSESSKGQPTEFPYK
jgi:hypothetical protein